MSDLYDRRHGGHLDPVTWRREHGRKKASKHTLAILDEIERKVATYEDPRPVVSSVRIGAGLEDVYDFEVEVELAPGATLSVRYQSVDDEYRTALRREGGAVAWEVVDAIKEYSAFGADALADLLHELRVRIRKTVAEWSAGGTHVSLLDIRLVHTSHWCAIDGPAFAVRLRTLNDRLRPSIAELEVDQARDLDAVLDANRPGMAGLFAMQSALARQGADGMVDQLVVNAIAQESDVAGALRGIAAGLPYGLTQALTVFMYGGHVQCHGQVPNSGFSWNRSSVTLSERRLSASAAEALRGLPITALVQHPVLSDDMIISNVSSQFEYGRHFVGAQFEQPRLLFCSGSGRVWSPGGAADNRPPKTMLH